MIDPSQLLPRLAQIQSRHTGKVPFGALDDLEELYRACDPQARHELMRALRERASDPFWSAFVRDFLATHPGED